MKLLFLLPVATQARFRRRIAGVQAEGTDARALTFERDYLPGKPLPCPTETLGTIEHRRYLGRAGAYLRAIGRVRTAAREVDAIHAFGLDLALLAWLATRGIPSRPALAYEVGDVREVMTGSSLTSRGLRAVERFLVRRCRVTVVTSPAYVDGYFVSLQGLDADRFLTIENKLPADFAVPDRPLPAPSTPGGDHPIRIGYFGLLRCRDSWQALKRILELAPGRFEVLLRGQPWHGAVTEDEIATTRGAEYGGTYLSPDELPAMYASVDLVWVAHHHGANNLRWARANRFYEACAFGRPMIGQQATVDGGVIEERDLGPLIDLADVETSARQVARIDRERWTLWATHVAAVPEAVYRHGDEHARLLARLRGEDAPPQPADTSTGATQ